jgi:hypothetical protein
MTITINMDNAAFADDNAGPEAARILREIADSIDGGGGVPRCTEKLRDINGNTVGTLKVTGKPVAA